MREVFLAEYAHILRGNLVGPGMLVKGDRTADGDVQDRQDEHIGLVLSDRICNASAPMDFASPCSVDYCCHDDGNGSSQFSGELRP